LDTRHNRLKGAGMYETLVGAWRGGGGGRGAHFFEDFSHGAIPQSAFRGFVSGETYAIDTVSTVD
jgi:hypothetical protein